MFRKVIALALVISMLVSCSMPSGNVGRPSERQLMERSAKMLECQYEMVRSKIIEEEGSEFFELEAVLTGEEIVRGLLSEERGSDYLEFLYYSDKFQSTEEVYDSVSGLIPDEELEKIKEIASGIERTLFEEAEEATRALSATQKSEFYRDLRALAVKSVVLLTAALVYAFLPDYMIFGKVTAASGVAIAAGVLSSTLLAIVEWKDSGVLSTTADNFDAWLAEVTKDPAAAWAIAAGMIATGKAVNANPVTTAVAIAVFALYGITDDLAQMLKTYNFKIPV